MERWFKILKLLSENDYITNKQLSEQLGVSKRTVYNDISALKKIVQNNGARIETRPHYGSILVVENRIQYQTFLDSKILKISRLGDTSKIRAIKIIQEMISAAQPLKFDELCERLYISRSTLKNDLKQVRSILKKYDLHIESYAYKGSVITGTENNVRKCLTDIDKIMMNESNQSMNHDMKSIAQIIRHIFTKYHFRMPEYAFNNLVVHMYIAVIRVQLGYAIEEVEGYERFIHRDEKEMAMAIISETERAFNLSFPRTELGYVILHLEGKKYTGDTDNSFVPSEIYDIVMEMLDEVDSMFHYNFKHDFELISMLAMHLVTLEVRIIYDMTLDNPLIKEIRERALLSFEMANVACSKLADRYDKKITQDEMAYIALHFQLAIERYKEKYKKNVLIVCDMGQGSAKYLMYQIKKQYGNYLNVIDTHESADFTNVKFDSYDYILTTVPIEQPVPLPIIEITSMFKEQTYPQLEDHLHVDEQNELLRFFSEDRFVAHMQGHAKQEILRELCDIAISKGYVSMDFYQHVLKREELGKTSFGNRIAIPHPYRPEGDYSFVVTGILDEPVLWDDEPVQIVFLLSMKAQGDPNLQLFYKSLGRLLSSKENVDILIKEQSFEKLISILYQLLNT